MRRLSGETPDPPRCFRSTPIRLTAAPVTLRGRSLPLAPKGPRVVATGGASPAAKRATRNPWSAPSATVSTTPARHWRTSRHRCAARERNRGQSSRRETRRQDTAHTAVARGTDGGRDARPTHSRDARPTHLKDARCPHGQRPPPRAALRGGAPGSLSSGTRDVRTLQRPPPRAALRDGAPGARRYGGDWSCGRAKRGEMST